MIIRDSFCLFCIETYVVVVIVVLSFYINSKYLRSCQKGQLT